MNRKCVILFCFVGFVKSNRRQRQDEKMLTSSHQQKEKKVEHVAIKYATH